MSAKKLRDFGASARRPFSIMYPSSDEIYFLYRFTFLKSYEETKEQV